MVFTNAHWATENNKKVWQKMINIARRGNNGIVNFRNAYNKGPFSSWGLGNLVGAWKQAQQNAGQAPPPVMHVPKSINNFKIGNGLYKLGNSTYTKLKRNGNVFYKNNNKTIFYKFSPYTSSWESNTPAQFYRIGKANRPPTVNGNIGYIPTRGGFYRVKRYAPGFNFWVPKN
jgi:hypothetical protein